LAGGDKRGVSSFCVEGQTLIQVIHEMKGYFNGNGGEISDGVGVLLVINTD